jgi:membrane associated rhomboid family serine protease
MIIPIAHENLRGRRWPYITIGIIALNTLIFLVTTGPMEVEQQKVAVVQAQIIVLSARFPGATMSPVAYHMVQLFKKQYPAAYKQIGATDSANSSKADEVLKTSGWTESEADSAMTDLCNDYATALNDSIAWNYAFHPYQPRLISYVTANFLHGGWLHLIFNMWFLWLAGTIIEDTWGRIVYPIFYLVAGLFALLAHAAFFPGSMTPVLGASGAIAALMGAFFARFPTTKVKMMWLWFFGIGRYSFYVPAYVVLPLWLVIQVVWGILGAPGVAYWAHVGGFAFGMLAAVALKASGIEEKADQAIEAKVSWTADPRIVQATQLLVGDQPTLALETIDAFLKEQPDSAQGLDIRLRALERLHRVEECRATLGELCRVHLFGGDRDLAWECFEHFRNMGGETLSRGVWFEMCRFAEEKKDWVRAVDEYERFARANANERTAVTALISAGTIALEKLHRADRANILFRMAAESASPHGDLDKAIEQGLARCAPVPAADDGGYLN